MPGTGLIGAGHRRRAPAVTVDAADPRCADRRRHGRCQPHRALRHLPRGEAVTPRAVTPQSVTPQVMAPRDCERGQVTVMIIGFVVLLGLLVVVVVNASSAYLAHRSLVSAAD